MSTQTWKVAPDATTPLMTPDHRMPHVPWYLQLRYSLHLHTLRLLLNLVISCLHLPFIQSPSTRPTFIRSYPSRPTLKNRIFIPKAYKDSDGKLPLYIDIHGGGFALMQPIVDDPFCSAFANQHNIVVISLDYPKAPRYRFPIAIEALTDTVVALLKDASLPIDIDKVAIGGCSAGGNLALGVSQADSLRGKIKGAVAFYPPLNFAEDKSEKYKLLQKEWEKRKRDGIDNGEVPAQILPESDLRMFSWGYLNEGQDLKDPRLSPLFADRNILPEKICVIGCELDVLWWEDKESAVKLAGGKVKGMEGDVWERNGVRWEKVLGEDHGFDNNVVVFGQRKIRMRARTQALRDDVAGWLHREVYS